MVDYRHIKVSVRSFHIRVKIPEHYGTSVTIVNNNDIRITRNGDTRIARNGDTRVAHNTTTGNPRKKVVRKRNFRIRGQVRHE